MHALRIIGGLLSILVSMALGTAAYVLVLGMFRSGSFTSPRVTIHGFFLAPWIVHAGTVFSSLGALVLFSWGIFLVLTKPKQNPEPPI
jgi:hypothetical protein